VQDERAALDWLLSFVRPHRVRLAAILLLSLVSTGLGLAQPYITKYLIDDGLLAGRFDIILWLCALMFLVGIAASLLGALNRWHYVDVSARILHALRESVFSHLLTLSPTYYARTKGGDILARLDGDIAEIQRFAVDTFLAFVNGFLALLGALALMLGLSWELTLLALALLPANILFLHIMRPRVERMNRSVRERASNITAFFFENLSAVKFIQSVAAEQRETQRLGDLNEVFRQDMLRLQMTNYATGAIPGLMTSFSTAAVFIVGGYMLIQHQLSLGTLIAFSAYLARATGPLQTLLGLYVALQRARVSLARVQEVTQTRPAIVPPVAPVAFPVNTPGAIYFKQVSFRYSADSPEVIRNVDITLPPGKKIGLIGDSGVGKSTLIDLLHRHYDPDVGTILLDGIDLRQLEPGELRRRIAVVAQDTVLFSGSVIDNIRYAAPYLSDELAMKAAKLARVDEFVKHLPRGYQTDVGSRGTRLSGGQRQRIAIARALLQNPLVLILDEATSEVDQFAETQIISAIDQLFAKRTRIFISHRPQTLKGADVILQLIDGRLIPQGLTGQQQETVH
jgi:ATP-binding cassette subfamily B protein